ncbi:MAG: protein kinase domain-containing protein [Thermoleophilaceae bacterium]
MAQPAPGTVVAGCRIEDEIGRGGMGVVYRAIEQSLQRTVALKLIAPELTTNQDFRERFKRESRLAASIEHPNVIPVYAAGEADELLYLVMRFIPGTDLRAVIEEDGALDPSRASRIVAQVASALAAAHRKGLIHRDVKPANVLIERDGSNEHAYLTDFGIARDVGRATALTRTGMLVGTLDYIAPERLEDRAGDGRSDIYALGCVLFEALTGRVPFPRDSDVAKMYAHMNEPVPSVREIRPDVPQALANAAAKAMAKNPDDRYDTADELAATLRSEATTLSGVRPAIPQDPTMLSPTAPAAPAPPQTPPPRAPPPRTPPPQTPPPAAAPPPAPRPRPTPIRPAPAPPPPPPPAERRRRGGLLVAGGALLAVAAIVVVVLVAGGGSSSNKKSASSTSQSKSLDIASSKAQSPIDVGAGIDGIEVGSGFVWDVNKNRGTLQRIDPSSRKVTGTTQVGANPDSIAVGSGSVWVTNTDDDTISQVDPKSGKVSRTLHVGDGPEGIAAGKGAIWVANQLDGTVSRIDPGSGAARTIPVGTNPIQIAFDQSNAWVTNSGDGFIQKLDGKTGKKIGDGVQIGGQTRGIASAAGLLWVSVSDKNEVAVIDPSANRVVKRITVPANPREVRAGEGGVWVTCADGGSVVAIDTSKRDVAAEVPVQGAPFGLGVGEGKAWAGSTEAGLLTPVKPG